MHQAVSILTIVFSLAAKAAMGSQILMNWRRKTTAGMSVPFFAVGMLSYDFWVLSGFVNHSLILILGQGPGAVLALVIVSQYLFYRRTQPPPDHVTARAGVSSRPTRPR